MRIDRCVCTQRTFEDLLTEARANHWPLQVLMDKTDAGHGCTMCRPYLSRCHRTGQTVFNQILSESDEPDLRHIKDLD
jgi:hypothetical protein